MASKFREEAIQPLLGQVITGRKIEYWFNFHILRFGIKIELLMYLEGTGSFKLCSVSH